MKTIKSFGLIAIFVVSMTLMSFSSSDHSSSSKSFEDCSLSATGTVESAEFGTMTVTITVTGPCDISLTRKLRAAIAEFRAEAAQ